ncbi:MAG: tetratricopeptide repeat protein [Psychromonas sp.]|nr:tetratricopeptide repeat protein [Psychromonas sp.]
MKLENINTDVQECSQQSLTRIPEGYNFETHTLFAAVTLLEAELTQKSVHETTLKLLSQQVVLKSALSEFKKVDLRKLTALLYHIYHLLGYQGDWKTLYRIENCFISNVLVRRKGGAIPLGILLIKALEANGFKACGVIFANMFIVKINFEHEVIYVDAFTGDIQNWGQLEVKLRGHLGNYAKLTPDMLRVALHATVIKDLISSIKVTYLRTKKFELALVCCDILLRIDPDDAYERRERGCLFQELNCVDLAVKDFNLFIAKYPHDPTVSILQKQIQKMRYNQPIIH